MCYDVLLNNQKITTISAKNEEEALFKAMKIYGLEIDVKEIPCKEKMNCD